MPPVPADSQVIQDKLMARAGFAEAIKDPGVAPEYAVGLYRVVLQRRPKLMLEVGMANGAATLAILSALSDLGGERLLISVDPYQATQWANRGVNNVQVNGLSGLHRLIQAPDYLVLPDLLRQHTVLEAAYVDGWHTFDYVMLDFFYLDKLLKAGGIIGFNDCGFPAIYRALRFVQTHRRYTELDIGLQPNYKGRNAVASLGRRLLNRVNNDRWFEKAADWEPDGMFYAPF